jgi:hypothetical protein
VYTFHTQIYCRDEAYVLSLTDPVPVMADDHDHAARLVTGGGVVADVGHPHDLAAKIWRIGPGYKPIIKLYYRKR